MISTIFFGSTDEVLHQMFKDLKNNKEIMYKQGVMTFKYKINYFLFRICFSKFINTYIKIPFKKRWFPYFIKSSEEIALNSTFIFTKDNIKYLEFGYGEYLRNEFPKCKIVLLFLDIHALRNFNFKSINNLYDIAYTFDKVEAEKYGISYYPLCYSRSILETKEKDFDICFIGQDKGRIEKIYKLYTNAISLGLKVKIIVCGKCARKREYSNTEIEFVDSIPYKKVLEIISKAKFNLEICLTDTASISIRLYEAIMFNQGLITNNLAIMNSPYYNSSFVHILDFDNIDLSFIKDFELKENTILKEKISPLTFIDYLKN